jgi:hypothetical protein
MPPPRKSGYTGNAKPHGPGGINITDHVEPRCSRNDGRDEHAGKKSHHDGGKENYDDGHQRRATVAEARRKVTVIHMAEIARKNLHAAHQHHLPTKKEVADASVLPGLLYCHPLM